MQSTSPAFAAGTVIHLQYQSEVMMRNIVVTPEQRQSRCALCCQWRNNRCQRHKASLASPFFDHRDNRSSGDENKGHRYSPFVAPGVSLAMPAFGGGHFTYGHNRVANNTSRFILQKLVCAVARRCRSDVRRQLKVIRKRGS